MPYGGDPAHSNTAAVRALLRDTPSSSPVLTDNEVTWLVAQHPNVYFAASVGADMIAGHFSDSVVQKKVGDLSWTKGSISGDVASQYRNLSKELRATAARMGIKPMAGGISVSDKATQVGDSDWDNPQIGLGMHDEDTSNSTSGRWQF